MALKNLIVVLATLLAVAAIPAQASDSIYLPNLNKTLTGTSLGGGHYGLDISGNITASSASAGLTGQPIPTYADFIGASKAGVLTGLLLGQQTMANSLSVTISSDQAAIPISGSITATNPSVGTNAATAPTSSTEIGLIDGTGKLQGVSSTNPLPITGSISASNPSVSTTGSAVPTSATMVGGSDGTNLKALKVSTTGVLSVDGSAVTQPISAASLPLPAGAATAAKQPALGTAGTASTDVITVQGIASMTALKVDGSAVTQPVSAASLPLPTGAATSANQTTGNTSLATIATNTGKTPINTTGSGSGAAATVSTVITLSAPANAVGFVLQNLDTSTANIRWAVGRTASSTLGQQLQPGRDTGFIPVGANVSLVAESGTQNYDIQWVSQ